jgi:hypothetical protein
VAGDRHPVPCHHADHSFCDRSSAFEPGHTGHRDPGLWWQPAAPALSFSGRLEYDCDNSRNLPRGQVLVLAQARPLAARDKWENPHIQQVVSLTASS